MTTRSGAHYKPMEGENNQVRSVEGPQTHLTREISAESQRTAEGAQTSDLSTISDMLKVLLEDKSRRDQEERERMERRREEEHERRMEEMQRQLEHYQRLVTEQSISRRRTDTDSLKLTKLGEGDDIEAYLTTFERIMEAHEVRRERWSYQLAPQLTGKAQQAYAALPPDEAKNYDAVKTAILRRFNINEETYRQRFRTLKPKDEESPKELMTRLQDLASRWTRETSSHQELLDLLVREQFLKVLPQDVRVAVLERQPKDCEEASQIAENFLQARASAGPKQPKTPTTPCPLCGRRGHWAKDCPAPQETDRRNSRPGNDAGEAQRRWPTNQGPKASRPLNTDIQRVRCFNCKETGHYASRCPKRSMYCGQDSAPSTEQENARRRGTVNGVYCSDIVVDTGATQTLVHRKLVSDDDILDGEVNIKCAHGDTVAYPLAVVKMTIGGRDIITTAAVSKTLPTSVLLGWDVPELMTYITGQTRPTPIQNALAATTRQQAQRQNSDEAREEVTPEASTAPETAAPEEDSGDSIFSFDDSLFAPTGPPRKIMTRSQKRENRLKYRWATTGNQSPTHGLDISADQLKSLQDEDESLQHARAVADGTPTAAAGEEFFRRDGLIYRNYRPPGRHSLDEDSIEQLVLPKECRAAVLQLAHDIPMAGHLGKKKTSDRVLQRFYWPGVYRDVEDHIRICEQCQRSAPKGKVKAPLIPLPIMEEPFKRIAMDVVGPLPRSSSGKRFILVICDYATRYPETIALRTVDAPTIAEELLKFFARMGVPEEILTDQGTNFTSQLLAEVYRLLHIKPIRTTPYHPQTDGLVERFNNTLKAMLRKAADDEGKDWDRLLPYLLFAYREVPQASTGFSPFELVYGRHVRGPLDVLKESWETSSRSTESVVSYVLTIQERLEKLRDLVHENLQDAQATQKAWYDRHARNREFQSGDQVLVLLPTSTNKLLAGWRGPYTVLRQVSPVNYEIEITDARKKRRIFHINMLRQWHSPCALSLLAEEVSEEHCDEADNDVAFWNDGDETPEGPTIGDELATEERGQLNNLLQEFRDVLQNKPGKTNVAEYRIRTGTAAPIRLPPYRIPHAYRDTVKKELEEMEEEGIIERSESEWAFPIVLVKKKDDTLRMCVDYRRLNAVAEADAYPMPRVDDLIDSLGKAKYVTTLDLARGYWQVPVNEESRPRTAFTTPYGLFQFRVMPFGLHGAPATFQRMMDSILREFPTFAAAYLDDVVIHSDSWEDHLMHIRAVLLKLREAGLTVKTKKCQIAMTRCCYLGHIVGSGKVRPEETKVQTVRNFPTPTTKRKVREFLGLTGYYRKFIASYAEHAAPLTSLTRKNAPNRVIWTSDCEESFKTLKEKLCSQPILTSPDFTKEFILQTDASAWGIGAVLSQQDNDNIEHPIAYYSRKLLPRETRYSTIEKECLAIKAATHHFRVYLLGRKFTIQTDHRALEWLDRLKDNNARLTRWSLALQPYDFQVRYRAGHSNGNADVLSRIFNPAPTTSSQDEKGGV